MNAPAQLALYLAILRKHALLMAGSAAVVVAAGLVYLSRQEPLYRVAATLTIETPVRSLDARELGVVDFLSVQQEELQTQVVLLRENSGQLAQKVVARLREQGIDTDAHGYTEGSLPANVRVEFIPGTRAVSFSLTGRYPESLPAAVNTYAEVYRDWSEDKTGGAFEAQLEMLQQEYDDAQGKLTRAESELRTFQAEHEDLNLAAGENPEAKARDALAALLPSLETDVAAARAERAAIVAAVSRLGVEIRETDAGFQLAVRDASESAPLEQRLVSDEVVVALPVVRSNEVFQHVLESQREAEQRDRRLASESWTEEYPARRQAREEADLAKRQRGKVIASTLEVELARIRAQAADLETRTTRLRELEEKAQRNNRVLREFEQRAQEVESLRRQVGLAHERLISVTKLYLPSSSSAAGGGGQAARRILIATPASPSRVVQVAPRTSMLLGLTAFAAVAVGLGLVLLLEYLDDTMKSKEDFDRYVGLPFLGFIPRIETKDAPNPDLASEQGSGSAIGEAFRAVRTSILFSRSGRPVRSILITSAGPGEGKTTVATNLAVTLAKHKAPVLLIDADLRRPRIAKSLGLDSHVGLTNYLVGEMSLAEIVQPTSVEGLFAITSGPVPPNPAELLHGEALAKLLEEALEKYERVIIDSPPVVAVSDARVIASRVDGLYLVISMGKTSWRVIQRAVESLTSIGFAVHGAILNNMTAPTGRYGYYYYRDYGYGKSYYHSKQEKSAPPR